MLKGGPNLVRVCGKYGCGGEGDGDRRVLSLYRTASVLFVFEQGDVVVQVQQGDGGLPGGCQRRVTLVRCSGTETQLKASQRFAILTT